MNYETFDRKEIARTGRYRYYDGGVLVAKDCVRCLETVPTSDYDGHPRNPDRLQSDCMQCAKKRRNASIAARKKVKPDLFKDNNKVRAAINRSRTPEEVEARRAELRPDGLKRCEACKLRQRFVAFCIDSIQADGLRRICRLCASGKWFDWKVRPYLPHWVTADIKLTCYVCGDEWRHSDHVIPEALDGPDRPENRLPMCETHNCSKSDTPLAQWLSERYSTSEVREVMHRVMDEYGVWPYTSKDIVWKQA